MEHSKLYELSVVEKEGEFSRPLSFSFDTEKLRSSIYHDGNWTVISKKDSKLAYKTDDDKYPIYLISEVNLII